MSFSTRYDLLPVFSVLAPAMLSANFKSEITWFFTGCLAALVIGTIVGWPASTLVLFMAAYVVWVLYRLESIVSWLRSGAKAGHAPFSHWLCDEMVELIHREKKYSRKQKNRYRKSLAQFNSLAANLPDAIIVMDSDFVIRWCNPASGAMLNIHPERDLGQRIDNLIRNPEFGEFLSSDNDASEVELPGPVASDRVLAIRKVLKDNRMTVLIAADITQRVKVREMRKAFVADVSHELRTPLTVIRGYLEMLQEDDTIEPPVMDAVNELTAQSDRMRGIVDDLLVLSKLEANLLGEREGEIVNVAAMIRSMIGPLKKEASRHRFELNLDDSLAVLGSEREIYSACNNLLTNAIKYTGDGTIVSVSWQLDDNTGSALYEVSDNGPGIEARHLSRLSERFYRVDAGRSRQQGGTGLGLAIVKHAIQRHGGYLDIKSHPGSGSQFTAAFPANRVQLMSKVANQ